MTYYIGIDPSINSSGITIRDEEGNVHFYIVKGGNLTKKEISAQSEYHDIFHYACYNKIELKNAEDEYERELFKTRNFINIVDLISKTINSYIGDGTAIVCMEGISYGSIKSSAVMDLAGLNYLLREKLLDFIVVDELIIAPPAEVKRFATGSGNANKELMISAFKGSWPDFNLPKLDDICDSWFMSKYAQKIYENR